MSRGMRIAIVVAVAGIVALAVSQAFAQQPPEDGKVAIYKQLLTRSNDELAVLGGQLQAAQIENASLKAQLEKRKAEDNAPAEKKP